MKRILLIRTDRLGDVVLTLPLLPVLRRHFPEAQISMLVNTYTSPVLKGNQYLDEVLLYDNSSNLIPFSKILRSLRAHEFDTAIVVHPTFRLALLIFLAQVPARVGTGYRWYSFLFNRRVYEHRKDARRHEVGYNLNLLTALGCRWQSPLEFPIAISSENVARVRELCKDMSVKNENHLVIIHPGSGGSARDWTASNFGKLASRCIEEMAARVILTGGKGEEHLVQEALNHIPQGALNLGNRLDVMDLAALIESADLFVSNSTGPLHIAAAVGTPVVAIYPPIRQCSPERWGPYTTKKKVFVPDRNLCARCQGGECEGSDCMDQITVEEVFMAAKKLIMEDNTGERRELDAQGHFLS